MNDQKSLNQALFDALMSEQLPQVNNVAAGKPSFGIVNSRQNGKRCSFSQSLVKKLDLVDEVYAMPALEARKLVIGRVLPFPSATVLHLRGEGKKLAYAADFVEMITKMFGLDFSKHVSQTFYDIDFDKIDGNTVGIIKFPAVVPTEAKAAEIEATDAEATAQEVDNLA